MILLWIRFLFVVAPGEAVKVSVSTLNSQASFFFGEFRKRIRCLNLLVNGLIVRQGTCRKFLGVMNGILHEAIDMMGLHVYAINWMWTNFIRIPLWWVYHDLAFAVSVFDETFRVVGLFLDQKVVVCGFWRLKLKFAEIMRFSMVIGIEIKSRFSLHNIQYIKTLIPNQELIYTKKLFKNYEIFEKIWWINDIRKFTISHTKVESESWCIICWLIKLFSHKKLFI